MVAHLGLSTDDLLHEEIGIIIAEILSASEKAECYEEVDNQSQCISSWIQNNNFWVYLMYMTYHIEKSKNYYFELK